MTTWPAVIEAEPALEIVLSDDELESALEAIADFTDLKSPWTIGHSRGVADLARAATKIYGLSDDGRRRLVRRAGLVHDLGRLGVSNAIWDKRGTLTAAELERVRLHPYLTERMLASSGALASVGRSRSSTTSVSTARAIPVGSRATRSRRRGGSSRRPTPITR